jgi:hypothetical protein
MTLDLAGKIHCLAEIVGRIEGVMENSKVAAKVLVIDGCKDACAHKGLAGALNGRCDCGHFRSIKREYLNGLLFLEEWSGWMERAFAGFAPFGRVSVYPLVRAKYLAKVWFRCTALQNIAQEDGTGRFGSKIAKGKGVKLL